MSAPLLTPTVSTIPGTVLALMEKLQGLTWPTLLGTDNNVEVFDGITGTSVPANYVTLGAGTGIKVEPGKTWTPLGAPHYEEAFSVGCEVSCLVGGSNLPGDFGVSDAQRSARSNAFAIFETIRTALRADLRLTNVTDPPGILWSSVKITGDVVQTDEEDPEAAAGRACTLPFSFYAVAVVYSPTGAV